MYSNDPVLCLVKPPYAYFTTQSLDEQSGDRWDCAFYCWAGEPDGFMWWNDQYSPWRIAKVAYQGLFDLPDSCYSVNEINAGKAPWISSVLYRDIIVTAGTPFSEFVHRVEKAGGLVEGFRYTLRRYSERQLGAKCCDVCGEMVTGESAIQVEKRLYLDRDGKWRRTEEYCLTFYGHEKCFQGTRWKLGAEPRYKLRNTHKSSKELGRCSVCGLDVDEVYHQIGEFAIFNEEEDRSGPEWHWLPSLLGHKECLINSREGWI